MECSLANSLEVFVADDAFEGGAVAEGQIFDDCEIIREGDALEDGTYLKCPIANSFEFFVPDDAFEEGAFGEHRLFDDFELIRESDTREGGAMLECSRS